MSTRRGFLAGIFTLGKSEAQKPKPFAPFVDTAKLEACLACLEHKCVAFCPVGVIVIENNMPVLDFSKSGCDMCGDCLGSCEYDVFSLEQDARVKASVMLDVSSCMAYSGTICKSCYDPCDVKAIEFSGLFYPQIDSTKCTACGFCIKVCPTGAIGARRSES